LKHLELVGGAELTDDEAAKAKEPGIYFISLPD
jgi:hypothetical protein